VKLVSTFRNSTLTLKQLSSTVGHTEYTAGNEKEMREASFNANKAQTRRPCCRLAAFSIFNCVWLPFSDSGMSAFDFVKKFDAYPKTLDDFRVKTYAGAVGMDESIFFFCGRGCRSKSVHSHGRELADHPSPRRVRVQLLPVGGHRLVPASGRDPRRAHEHQL